MVPAFLALAAQLGAFQRPPTSPVYQVPASYLGLHIHRATPTDRFPQVALWPDVEFTGWRLWDAGVAWPALEPRRGEWRFEVLDRDVDLAEAHHVEILLPLGLTPTWASARPEEPSAFAMGNAAEPREFDDWRRYVRTVATRYRGRIRHYEIWNEPNVRAFFSGDVHMMVELVAVADSELKAVDSTNVVVSPAAATINGVRWLEGFLEAGGGRFVDVMGYHFYVSPKPPEAMVPLIDTVRAVMERHGVGGKALWNTETGWFIANHRTVVAPIGTGNDFRSKVLSDSEGAAYVVRALVIGWAYGLARFYWYAWDNTVMGLTEADGQTVKPAGMAYGIAARWMIGARLTSCAPNPDGVWIARLERPGRNSAWLVWVPSGRMRLRVPDSLSVAMVEDALAARHLVSDSVARSGLTVSTIPMLIELTAR